MSSRLRHQEYRPYCTFGLLTDQLPFQPIITEASQRALMSLSCGRCMHRHDMTTLKQLSQSTTTPDNILTHTASLTWSFAAVGSTVYCFRRGEVEEPKRRLQADSDQSSDADHSISSLLLVDRYHLLVGHTSGRLRLWNLRQEAGILVSTNQFKSAVKFLFHPATYLNKVLIVIQVDETTDKLLIWNVKYNTTASTLTDMHSIATISQSTALDVLAFGMHNGTVSMVNIKTDKVLFTLRNPSHEHPITAISFHHEHSLLLAGSRDGDIVIWNLGNREIRGYAESPFGAVTTIQQVPGTPGLFCVSYERNALLHWILDITGTPRKVRERVGNPGPPKLVRFLPEEDNTIATKLLAVCQNSEGFVIWQYIGGTSSQMTGNHHKSPVASQIVDIAVASRKASSTQMSEWSDIVTVHQNSRRVSLWRMDGCSQLKRKNSSKKGGDQLKRFLEPSKLSQSKVPASSIATCCDISHCCNFAIVGYSSGHVVVFNLQSHEEKLSAHVGTNAGVQGVMMDSLNRHIVVGDATGRLTAIPFRPPSACQWKSVAINLPAEICLPFSSHQLNGLMAVVVNGGTVCLVKSRYNDEKTACELSLVRKFEGDTYPVSCVRFSDDCTFLLVSSMSSTVRTYDISSGLLVDTITSPSPPTSFDLFDDLLVLGCRSDVCFYTYALNADHQQQSNTVDSNWKRSDHSSISLLSTSVKAVTTQPARSVWKALEHLDDMRSSLQPDSAVEKPASAPFFLPSVPNLRGFEFNLLGGLQLDMPKRAWSFYVDETELITALKDEGVKPSDVMAMLKKFTLFKLDAELSNVVRAGRHETTHPAFARLVSILEQAVKQGSDFDFISSIVNKISKQVSLTAMQPLHLSVISLEEQCVDLTDNLVRLLSDKWTPILTLYDQSMSLLSFLKNDPL